MTVSIEQYLMGEGAWAADLSTDPEVWAKLDPDAMEGKAHVYAYRRDGAQLYPPLVLHRRDGEAGRGVISGSGLAWWLGGGEEGPLIRDREFVSGADKLTDPSFDRHITRDGVLRFEFWSTAEDSQWVPDLEYFRSAYAAARTLDDTTDDDVMVSEDMLPVLPGQIHRLAAWVFRTYGSIGRVRLRTVYTGRFKPAELLVNGDLEDGSVGWTPSTHIVVSTAPGLARNGEGVIVCSTIPKPQKVVNGDFELGVSGWGGGTTFEIVNDPANARSGDWVLRCAPNPQPQFILEPGFEDGGAGWTDESEFPTDIEIVDDVANAYPDGGGTHVMRVGPVTPKQLLLNPDFENGLTNWYTSSSTTDPEATFYSDPPPGGVNDSYAATTDNSLLRPIKYLRSDADSGTVGVQAYTVVPGESYRLEGSIRAAPSTDGYAYLSLVFPHPTLEPLHPTWHASTDVEGTRHATDTFQRYSVEGTVPAGRTKAYVLFEVHDHTTGYWAVDDVTLTRTRGNRAKMVCDTEFPIDADTRYEISASVRAAGELQVGSVELGVVLKGAGLDDETVGREKGSTDFLWARVAEEFRARTGYTSAQPFVTAVDVVGAPVYVDNVRLRKIENNTDTHFGAGFAVTADQRYTLSAAVRSGPLATRGTIRVGVLLSGAGQLPLDFGEIQDLTDDAWVGLTADVIPPTGYTAAVPYVKTIDTEGDYWWADVVSFVKADNNRESMPGTAFPVIPERSYLWSAMVRNGPDIQRGAVALRVTFTATGRDPVVQEAELGVTDGSWTVLELNFSAPSGYDLATPEVVNIDVEGDVFLLDDMSISDTDDTTFVVDVVSPATNGDWQELVSVSTAPDGADHVHMEIVAEALGEGWLVDDASLRRTGVPLLTHADVVRSLLTEPTTGGALTVLPGEIDGAHLIPYDLRFVNRMVKEALEHFCRVNASPTMEWWIDVDRRLHAGPPMTTFVDHVPGTDDEVLLLEQDLDVTELPSVEINTESRVTDVVVVGDDRQSPTGAPRAVTAVASVPTEQFDGFGNVVKRTRLIEDPTVQHVGYAQALADDELARANTPTRTLTASLTGTRLRPPIKPGDWLYAYKPKAGLESPDYPTRDSTGRTVSPERIRLQGMKEELGRGHRLVVRLPDGDEFELPGVQWGTDSVSLEMGDPRPEFEADPQGGDVARQYHRSRVSRGR